MTRRPPIRCGVPLKPLHQTTLPLWRRNVEAAPPGAVLISRKRSRLLVGVIVCGGCGEWIGCNAHEIDQAGMITPAVECPSCGWNASVTVYPNPWEEL